MRSSASLPERIVVAAALLVLSGCAASPRHVARVHAVAGQHLLRGEKREPLTPNAQRERDADASAGYHNPTTPPN